MTIIKQKEIMNPLYVSKLENDVILMVFDGYAIGSDGNKYCHVGREIGDMLETVGWCCEIDKTVTVE